MQIIHTSPEEITEIKSDGLFGDCLCFADDEYSMGEVIAVYSIEVDEGNLLAAHDLDEEREAEVKAMAELIAISDGRLDHDSAFELLSDESDAWSLLGGQLHNERIAELSWDIQRLQGRIAAETGHDAFVGRDEQGTVYIVAMTGKLDRLERIR